MLNRLLLWATLSIAVHGVCPPVPKGYTFHPDMDSSSRSSSCIRDRAPVSWSVASQADACTQDPTCKAFQIDYMGSCFKRTVGNLFKQKLRHQDVWTAAPCPGIYIDQNNCTHSDNITLMCATGSTFAVQRGAVRMFASPEVYQSWGSPSPSIQGLVGGGCSTKGEPIDGCKYGPDMILKDNCTFSDGVTLLCMRGSMFHIINRVARMFPNSRIYKSWGSPTPDVRGVASGGCAAAGKPINGCKYGPWMEFKDKDDDLPAGASATALYFAVPNTRFDGYIIGNFSNCPAKVCEAACNAVPGCFMYEVEIGIDVGSHCWLKYNMSSAAVVAPNVTTYMPQIARTQPPSAAHRMSRLGHPRHFVALPDLHFPGHNIDLLRNLNPKACERACLKLPTCVMYEVGTASFAPFQCWLKSEVAAVPVAFEGVVAHVPLSAAGNFTQGALTLAIGGALNATLGNALNTTLSGALNATLDSALIATLG